MTVFEDWSAVMADVQGIRKGDVNQAQHFTFRGIDAVMNAVGPALRKHGVIVVPVEVLPERRDIQTARGTMMHETIATVTWRVYGRDGDSFDMQSVGEAMDAGDKSATKALSVAYRTVLLQSLTIPTDEPDPDLGPEISAKDAAELVRKAVGGDVKKARAAIEAAHVSFGDVAGLVQLAARINTSAVSDDS